MRTIMVLYLGTSPINAVYVSLLLNMDTSMVSLQFHVHRDYFFDMGVPTDGNPPTLFH